MAQAVGRTWRQKVFYLLSIWVVMAGCGSSASQAVELYRCTQNGAVEFRQTECPEGEQEITEVIEQSSGITAAEPGLRLVDKPKKDKPEKTKPVKRPRASEERCWKTEKKLEKVERHLRTGYKASQYQGLHQKQAEYEEYLQRFCAD